LAGYLNCTATNDEIVTCKSGVTVGFQQWLLQNGAYYAIRKKLQLLFRDDEYKGVLAFAKLSGPLATTGYAEVRHVTGGFGYNTSYMLHKLDCMAQFPSPYRQHAGEHKPST